MIKQNQFHKYVAKSHSWNYAASQQGYLSMKNSIQVAYVGFLFFLKKSGPTPAPFCLFSYISNTILQKNSRLSGIWTRIVGVEGEHADHLTTTTAQHM